MKVIRESLSEKVALNENVPGIKKLGTVVPGRGIGKCKDLEEGRIMPCPEARQKGSVVEV